MMGEIRKNDIGTIFEVTVTDSNIAVDVSTATVLQMVFRKPSGALITKTATFVTTGTDGKIQYITIAGDLDTIGLWYLQVYVEMPTGKWKSEIKQFTVNNNL